MHPEQKYQTTSIHQTITLILETLLMKRSIQRFVPLLLLLLVTLFVGCKDRFPPEPDPGDTTSAYKNITWHLVSYVTSGGTTVKVDPAAEATIRFSDSGTAAGYSGCNSFGGEYAADDSSMKFGTLWQTERYCIDWNELETNYLSGLTSTRSYKATSTSLHLYGNGAVKVLNFNRDCPGPDPTPQGGIVYNRRISSDESFDIVRLGLSGGSSGKSVGYGVLASSPIGGLMAYWSKGPGVAVKPSVVVSGVDGSGPKIVYTSDGAYEPEPLSVAISPTGKKVAYGAENVLVLPPIPPVELHVVDVATGKDFKGGDLRWKSTPAFSPNGERVAFYTSDGNLMVLETDGTGTARSIAQNANSPYSTWLSWSPDGLQIAYVGKDLSGNTDIYRTTVDGRALPANLTNDEAVDASPVWSPDGSQIAFSSGKNYPGTLTIIASDGSGGRTTPVERLITQVLFDLYPQWSPNGKEILFTTYARYPGSSISESGELTRVDLKSGAMTKVADSGFKGFWER